MCTAVYATVLIISGRRGREFVSIVHAHVRRDRLRRGGTTRNFPITGVSMSYGARYRTAVFIALAILPAVLGGCRGSEKHYALRGRVVAKSASGELTVDNENIPGFMPAMIMPYPVKDAQGLEQVQPGDVITANVVVQNNDNYWLEHLAITDKSGRTAVPTNVVHELLPGEKVPDVALVNQDGKTIHLGQLKGRAVLVTFIYTRCPLPNFCPLISSEFASIHKEMSKNPDDLRKTHLVSISLDPSYDTAPVLRKYGLAYLSDDASAFEHWDFVSTAPADLQKLAAAFGLEYFQQNNQISHSMSTVLLAPDGTVAKSWPGNEWKTSEVTAALRQATAVKE
jgi:protein SCO1/2